MSTPQTLAAAFGELLRHQVPGLANIDRATRRRWTSESDAAMYDFECVFLAEALYEAAAVSAEASGPDEAASRLHEPIVPTDALLAATTRTAQVVTTLQRRLKRAGTAEVMDLLGFFVGAFLRSDDAALTEWASGASRIEASDFEPPLLRQGAGGHRKKGGVASMAAPEPVESVSVTEIGLETGFGWRQGHHSDHQKRERPPGPGPFLVVDTHHNKTSTVDGEQQLKDLLRTQATNGATVVCLTTGRRVRAETNPEPEPTAVDRFGTGLVFASRGARTRHVQPLKKFIPRQQANPPAQPASPVARCVRLFACVLAGLCFMFVLAHAFQAMRDKGALSTDIGGAIAGFAKMLIESEKPGQFGRFVLHGITSSAVSVGNFVGTHGFALLSALKGSGSALFKATGASVPVWVASLYSIAVTRMQFGLPGQHSAAGLVQDMLIIVKTLTTAQALLTVLFAAPLLVFKVPWAYALATSGLIIAALAIIATHLAKQTVRAVQIDGIHVSEKINADPQALLTIQDARALTQATQGARSDYVSGLALEVYRSLDGCLDLLDVAVRRVVGKSGRVDSNRFRANTSS